MRSRDDYFTRQLPRVHLVEMDTSEWTSSDYSVSEAEKHTLLQRGYDATATMLDSLGNWLPLPD